MLKITSDNLPSCCYYTLLNGYLEINCLEDFIIRLWSLLTWTCLITFRGHIQPVFDVQFGPFGHYFASCSLDKTARL
ncbi:unnamed protein product [Rotaria sordida]|uniref:Uncharacterized protein n=1 Tax=Rotaria sordida TaxID=392033 RepID=A0A816B1H3_9BILA|nr:unnamed protein product [Rotaria sordida]CAF1602848.1 unnamed protein product [Rotaria sordida]